MFINTLPTHTKQVLSEVKKLSAIQHDFYLSGGTALALYLGHRESEDLDFFSQKSFDPEILQHSLRSIGELHEVELSTGTLNAYMQGVKLQFLEYPYKLLDPPMKWEDIMLSSIVDIACTKIMTISMRGSKKDFIDVYFLLQKYTLHDLLEKVALKYESIHYNDKHILKSLVYFDDADGQPMPRMHKDVNWEDVKKFFSKTIKEIA